MKTAGAWAILEAVRRCGADIEQTTVAAVRRLRTRRLSSKSSLRRTAGGTPVGRHWGDTLSQGLTTLQP
jgi:hypothetical protein